MKSSEIWVIGIIFGGLVAAIALGSGDGLIASAGILLFASVIAFPLSVMAIKNMISNADYWKDFTPLYVVIWAISGYIAAGWLVLGGWTMLIIARNWR